jgi:hypothetical protein
MIPVNIGHFIGNVIEGAALLIPFIWAKMDGDENMVDKETKKSLRKAFDKFL